MSVGQADDLMRDRQWTPPSADDQPRRMLFAQIIKRAVIDATTESTKPEICNDARRWIFSDDESEGSYAHCCAMCGLGPEQSRDRLVDIHGYQITECV